MTIEQIKIKNFGGIEDLVVELNKVNIFIGRQASGKSITAKLIYFFKGITREFFDSALAEKSKLQLEKKLLQKFEEYFPIDTWPSKNFEIVYTVSKFSISVRKEKSKLKIEFSDTYIKLFNYAKKIIKSDKDKFKPEDQFEIYRPNYKVNEKYLTFVQKELGDSSSFNPLYKAFENIFYGINWEIARGFSIFGGWHYGKVRTFEMPNFQPGVTPVTNAEFDFYQNTKWKTSSAIGIKLDIMIIRNLFGTVAGAQ